MTKRKTKKREIRNRKTKLNMKKNGENAFTYHQSINDPSFFFFSFHDNVINVTDVIFIHALYIHTR